MKNFVKIAKDQYVLYNYQGNEVRDISINSIYKTSLYTPTHIFTYPDGDPNILREIKIIDYTKSYITFFKDYKNNKCCIDIYDDQTNPYKCRIIGINGNCYENFEIYDVSLESNIALVAVVGRNMAKHSGVCAKVFQTLGESGINIKLLAQGPEELNIIIGVDSADYEKTISAIYDKMIG